MPINTFREHLTCFPNVKSFRLFTLELVYQVGGFAVGKGGDGISEAGVGISKKQSHGSCGSQILYSEERNVKFIYINIKGKSGKVI